MHSRVVKSGVRMLALCALLSGACALYGQSAAPAKGTYSYADSPSRWDIFVGYSYLAPHDTVNVIAGDGTVTPYSYDAINYGAIVSGTYYFNKYVGAQLEGSVHEYGDSQSPSNPNPPNNDGFTFGSAGLAFRYPGQEITPFAHAFVGGAYVGGPHHNVATWGPELGVGGGLDYETPLFHHHLAVRLFQVDYLYTHENYGPGPEGGRANINSVRASAGVVIHVGSILPPPPVTLACVASPSSVYPGDPVTVTATPGNIPDKANPTYTWTGTGVTGNGVTANVSTSGLSAGSYTVNGTVTAGHKPWQTAGCTAGFTVKEYEPPTLSCSVTPTTIKPGDSATVTAVGLSPQNLSLTYAYTASAGTVSGTGATATYSSTGAPTGPITITGTVTDAKGKTATCTTGLTIEAPPAPPAPKTQTLCSITFEKDKRRPTRVDNEAKACLDQVALSLQNQSDAKAVVVGEETAAEKEAREKAEKHHHHLHEADFAAQRAVDTKEYLVVDKGIDASRISVATGTTDGKSVENYLVPAGASFTTDIPGTTPVDETVVKPIKRVPLAERHHPHHKKAAANQ